MLDHGAMRMTGWRLATAVTAVLCFLTVRTEPGSAQEPGDQGTMAAAPVEANSWENLTEVRLPLTKIRAERGHCCIAPIPLLTPNERSDGKTGLRLFEDEVELTRAASLHAEIREFGGGRFSHWGPALYFSSSDGSDPTTNGRRYTIVFDRAFLLDESLRAMTPVAAIPPERIREGAGFEYLYDLPPAIAAWPSDSETINGSPLVVLEDGMALGPGHTRGSTLAQLGEGRYLHAGRRVRFSTSDNTDPRTNGRRYAIGLADPPDHHFIDPFASRSPPTVEALRAPVIGWPREGQIIRDARPVIHVSDPDAALLYYWELDVRPTFDSANLHRRPRVRRTAQGVNLVRVLDRSPSFSPQFEAPYRLGAIAPHHVDLRALTFTSVMAGRLGYGLAPGHEQFREVYEFVYHQFYPVDFDANIRDPAETWVRDRGFCISVNLLTSRLLEELGYRTRRAQVNVLSSSGDADSPLYGHSSLEAFHGGRWSIIDPWIGYFLPGTSFHDLAADARKDRYPVLAVPAGEGVSTLEGRRKVIDLSDYAMDRRYDRFDTWFAPYHDAESERLAFSGERAAVPVPNSWRLWPRKQMRVWVRVRSVNLPPEAVEPWMMSFHEARAALPEAIEVSPWTVVSFTIDLEAAYGFEREPR